MHMISPKDILDFWYAEPMRSKWFASTPQLDALIKERFEPVWEAAMRGELDDWLSHPDGCLALADKDLSVTLFTAAGLENNLRYARHHRELVRRFGRFPHRNAILGRASTPQELDYLNSKEAFKG